MSKPSPISWTALLVSMITSLALPATAQEGSRPTSGPLTIEKQGSFFISWIAQAFCNGPAVSSPS